MRPAVLTLAIVGFSLFPACFWRKGTREPSPQEVTVPAAGPERPSGGQYLAAPELPPAECERLARSALEARGWTVHASTRDDELIGSRFHNLCCLRWDVAGRWWCRVDQRSDLGNGQRVPAWDHPWEALRLLHLALPDSGPAEGWQWWRNDARPALDLAGLRQALIDPAPVNADRKAAISLAAAYTAMPDAAEARLRFDMLLRSVLCDPQRLPPGLLESQQVQWPQLPSVLDMAAAERRDPYTAIPATVDFVLPERGITSFSYSLDDQRLEQHLLLLQRHWHLIACWKEGDQATGWLLAQEQRDYRTADRLTVGSDVPLPDRWSAKETWRDWWHQHGRAWVDARAKAIAATLP